MKRFLFLMTVLTIVSCANHAPQMPHQQYALDNGALISLYELYDGRTELHLDIKGNRYKTVLVGDCYVPFIDTVVNDTIFLVDEDFQWDSTEDTSICFYMNEQERELGPLVIKRISHYYLLGKSLDLAFDADGNITDYYQFDSISMRDKRYYLFQESKCIASIPRKRLVCKEEDDVGYILCGFSYDTIKKIRKMACYKPKSQKIIWEYWVQ